MTDIKITALFSHRGLSIVAEDERFAIVGIDARTGQGIKERHTLERRSPITALTYIDEMHVHALTWDGTLYRITWEDTGLRVTCLGDDLP